MSDHPLLVLRGIEKSFPGVRALHNMSFSVKAGRVHVLCGENGAGKSTLCKIMNGLYQPDKGEMLIHGKSVVLRSPLEARAHKIAMIFQELNFVPEFSVAQNLFLGNEPTNAFGKIDWKKMRAQAIDLLAQEGLSYHPDTPLKDLSVSDIQMLEIVKAVSHQAKIVIMDEPTSAITSREVDLLFRKIEQLKKEGVGIVYISHKMDEIFRIADDISVLRDGELIDTREAAAYDIDTVIAQMVGRKLASVFPPRSERAIGEVRLETKALSRGRDFADVHFSVRAGEIVGFAGLMGAGRTEVARAIFGLEPATSGEILIHGKPAQIRSVQDALAHNIAMVSEDRKRYGIVPVRNLHENASLASLQRISSLFGLSHTREEKRNRAMCTRMNVKAPNLETLIAALSGGNQQKVVLAKWLLCDPAILLLDEPTRGIDVGAKFEIYKLMDELAQEGRAIVMISSEMEELIGVCDRMYVMAKGRITGTLARADFSRERIMKLALGA